MLTPCQAVAHASLQPIFGADLQDVFYELGIAHTLGRKAGLIAQTIDDIPFDVRDRRVIEYEYTPPGMQEFEDKLKKTLQSELGL